MFKITILPSLKLSQKRCSSVSSPSSSQQKWNKPPTANLQPNHNQHSTPHRTPATQQACECEPWDSDTLRRLRGPGAAAAVIVSRSGADIWHSLRTSTNPFVRKWTLQFVRDDGGGGGGGGDGGGEFDDNLHDGGRPTNSKPAMASSSLGRGAWRGGGGARKASNDQQLSHPHRAKSDGSRSADPRRFLRHRPSR